MIIITYINEVLQLTAHYSIDTFQFRLLFIMSFAKDVWVAYVINNIMDNCKRLCKEHCKGCQLKWDSIFLHQHEQLSLLEKIEKYFDSVRGNLLGDELEGLFKHFAQNESISTYRKKEMLEQTRILILYATPHSLFYGRWITVEHELIFRDMFIKEDGGNDEMLKMQNPSKLMKTRYNPRV